MVEKKTAGVIISISSNQVDGCWPRATIYAPTKAAVSKFKKNAAMERSLKGIRLEAAKRLPFKRFATTEEITQAVIYMASDKAAYITGTTLTVEGGATLPVVAVNDFVSIL